MGFRIAQRWDMQVFCCSIASLWNKALFFSSIYLRKRRTLKFTVYNHSVHYRSSVFEYFKKVSARLLKRGTAYFKNGVHTFLRTIHIIKEKQKLFLILSLRSVFGPKKIQFFDLSKENGVHVEPPYMLYQANFFFSNGRFLSKGHHNMKKNIFKDSQKLRILKEVTSSGVLQFILMA